MASLNPFTSITSLFKPYSALAKKSTEKPLSAEKKFNKAAESKEASEKAASLMWTVYHHFKKHHGMLNW